jgi:hypothetical protein
MKMSALFLDVGGVLLSNGRDRSMPKRAAETFRLDYDEMEPIFSKSPCRLADTACTFQLGKATGLPFFFPISYYSIYVALLAWVVVFAGLLHRILRNFIVG